MKTAAILLAASAALATAQVTNNNGTFVCAKPNAAYCAGTSLGTDIIIRCDAEGKGQPGRCSNNLVGQPPVGAFPASCWQSSETSGDGACAKNCVVYASLASTTFTLPSSECTPFFTASSSSTSSAATATSTPSASCSTSSTTKKPSYSSTFITATGTGGPKPTPPPSGGNGTVTSSSSHTPVGPTSSRTGPTTVPTAGAAVHQVGGALAIVGLVAAYFI